MGVKGLWRVLEPVSRPISTPESLAGQKVAIDVSIWLYQFTKVFPPSTTTSYAPLVLSGLFNRICKLLYYNIQPVFVFEGAAPEIKKRTTRERANQRDQANERYLRMARKILAAKAHISNIKTATVKDEATKETFESLDNSTFDEFKSDSISDDDGEEIDHDYLHQLDTTCEEFRRLPIDMQQEILLAKREHVFRQHISIVRGEENSIPALDFSNMQVDALVKRRKVAAELEKILDNTVMNYEQDYCANDINKRRKVAKRIASDSKKEYFLYKNSLGGWTIDNAQVEDVKNAKHEASRGVVDDQDYDNLFGASESGARRAKEDDFVLDAFTDKALHLHDGQATFDTAELSFNPEEYLSFISKSSTTDRHGSDAPPITIQNKLPIEIQGHHCERQQQVVDVKEDDVADHLTKISGLINNPSDDDNGILIESDPSSSSASTSASASCTDESLLDDFINDSVFNYDYIANGSQLPIENYDHIANDSQLLIEKLQAEIESLNKQANPSLCASLDPELIEDFKILLTAIGIPWIIAPGEAEAQCAFYQKSSLVDAVVSDDNDTVIYGSTKTLRHFFTNQKRIEMYMDRDIERELSFRVDHLILLAVLLGSDYGPGVRGIGPVKATRLLKILGGHNNGKPFDELVRIIREGLVNGTWPETGNDDADRKFLEKLSIHCALADPNESFVQSARAIAHQYLKPVVNETTPDFKWNLLSDLSALYSFLMQKLNWDLAQCKRIMEPIIAARRNNNNNHYRQSNLDLIMSIKSVH